MVDTPILYKITKIIPENKFVKTFWLEPLYLTKKIGNSAPGQYLMLWLPDLAKKTNKYNKRVFRILDQIPMSISDRNREKIAITVKNLGPTTNELHKYSTGRYVGVTGPLGNHFKVLGQKLLLVAGGMGLAPLRFLIKTIKKNNAHVSIDLLLGFKNVNELFFINELNKYCDSIHIVTDDGSHGSKGFVTDLLPEVFNSHDQIFSCGPEKMMKIVLNFSLKNQIPAQFSLERFMHCGIGVCGFCSLDGLLVCNDGPIFDSNILKDLKEFGKIRRTCSGRKEKV